MGTALNGTCAKCNEPLIPHGYSYGSFMMIGELTYHEQCMPPQPRVTQYAAPPRRSTDGAVDKEAADKFSNGVPDTTPGDMQTGCGCGSCRLIWNTWNLKRAYQAEREMVEKLNSSVAAAQELIYHEQDRAEAAERQRDELREALHNVTALLSAYAGHVEDGITDLALKEARKLLGATP